MLVHSPVTHARSLSLAQSVRAGEEPTNERRRASVFFGTSCCSGLLLPLFLPPSVAPSGLLCVPLTELTLPLVVHSLSLSLSLSLRRTESHHDGPPLTAASDAAETEIVFFRM